MRIRVQEGEIAQVAADAIALEDGSAAAGDRRVFRSRCADADGQVSEERVREVARALFARAEQEGVRSLALPPLGVGPQGLSLQRSAEILFEEAHRHEQSAEGREGGLQELCFVVRGEPAFRVFEQVQDAERIRASLARLRGAGRA